jgi:hypothetical protein
VLIRRCSSGAALIAAGTWHEATPSSFCGFLLLCGFAAALRFLIWGFLPWGFLPWAS